MAKSGYFLEPNVALTSTPILSEGDHRTFVMISNPTQDALYISFALPAAVNMGILIPPNVRAEKIYKEEIGGLINAAIYGIFGNTAGQIGLLVGYDS